MRKLKIMVIHEGKFGHANITNISTVHFVHIMYSKKYTAHFHMFVICSVQNVHFTYVKSFTS